MTQGRTGMRNVEPSCGLSLACGDYEITRPLIDGRVKPAGIELVVVTPESRERHWRVARDHAYDICEFNTPAYFMGRDRGLPYVGLPVYLHRRFRHGFLFVNSHKGFKAPKDLNGKRIAGTNYSPASNIWMRGILEEFWEPAAPFDHLGDRARRGHSVRSAERSQDRTAGAGRAVAGGSRGVRRARRAADTVAAQAVHGRQSRTSSGCSTITAQVEIAYWKKTGIFPIMHVTIIREQIVKEHPWVGPITCARLRSGQGVGLCASAQPADLSAGLAQRAIWDEQHDLLGDDPGPTVSARRTVTTSTPSCATRISRA